jgi:Glycosyltransferase family 87
MRPTNLRLFVTLLLAGMFCLHAVYAWNVRDLLWKGYPDFTTFYAAGKILRDDQASRLYDPQTQFQTQQQFAAEVSIRKGPLPYMHPPFEAVLFLPLTFFSYRVAYVLWDLLNLLILFLLPWLLRPHVPLLQKASLAFWWLAELACFPVFIALLQGQDVLLLLLLLVLAFISLKSDNAFVAGCWLGLGLFRFHVVLPLVLILIWRTRGKAIFGFVLSACGLMMLSLGVVGWRGTLAYPEQIWRLEQGMERSRVVIPGDAPNLRGLLEGWVLPNTWKGRDFVVAVVSIALLVAAAWLWKQNPEKIDLGFSLCVIVAVLCGYYAFAYDLSLLILPVVLVLNHVGESQRTALWRNTALVGPIFVLFCTPLQMFLISHHELFSWMTAAVLLWGWAIARETSTTSSSP